MAKKAVQTLSEDFAMSSLRTYEARIKGDIKGIVDTHRQLAEIYCQLRDAGDEGIAALKRLSQHENTWVRIQAAADILWVDMPYAMLVLDAIADEEHRHPEHTIERAASGSARLTYSLVARRGEPMSADPYIKWKAKQQAKEQK